MAGQGRNGVEGGAAGGDRGAAWGRHEMGHRLRTRAHRTGARDRGPEPAVARWIIVRPLKDSPRPSRRSVLGLGLGACLAATAAGCSSTPEKPPAARGDAVDAAPPGSPGSPEPGQGVLASADEEARTALLGTVRDLTALAGAASAVADGSGAAILAAITQGLTEQAGALTTPEDDPAPAVPSPGPGATPEQVLEALGAASVAAASEMADVSPPVARLAAALAAGHAVSATTLARTTGLGAPAGAAPPPVDAAGARTDVAPTLPVPPRDAAPTLSTARDVESQARYAYGVAAAHLTGEALSVALALRAVHDDAVGALSVALESSGARPAPPPREAYLLPFPVTDDASAAMLGAGVEDACADAWADVVAAVAPKGRAEAAAVLTGRAQQGAQWRFRLGQGASLLALPGLSGRT